MALDGSYAAFGLVIEGLDVLEAITKVPVSASGGLMNVPTTEIVVNSISRRTN
jgi:cyclophilin family peptidyl-prolyl cis-trans isomerase